MNIGSLVLSQEIFEHLLIVLSHCTLYHVSPRFNCGLFYWLLPSPTCLTSDHRDIHRACYLRWPWDTDLSKRQTYDWVLKDHIAWPGEPSLISENTVARLGEDSLLLVESSEVICLYFTVWRSIFRRSRSNWDLTHLTGSTETAASLLWMCLARRVLAHYCGHRISTLMNSTSLLFLGKQN